MPAPNPLACDLAGIALASPVILAAGTAGVLHEMTDALDLSRVGALTTKSITLRPRDGNDTWRLIDAPGTVGMLNAIGLANPGLDDFLAHAAPRAASLPCPVIASVAGFSIDDYAALVANLDEHARSTPRSFPAIELNVSCPNVHTGSEFGSSPDLLRQLLTAVRPLARATKLLVKLGPMAVGTGEFSAVARAATDAGADALCIANTAPAMSIDVRSRRPRLANLTGGLSGPAIHPIALRLVYQTRKDLGRHCPPIVGIGGVMNWRDAAEFVLAGATAVQVGTALFVDPRAPLAIAKGLARWTRHQGRTSISELVGDLREPESLTG